MMAESIDDILESLHRYIGALRDGLAEDERERDKLREVADAARDAHNWLNALAEGRQSPGPEGVDLLNKLRDALMEFYGEKE